jgi:tRNA 2-thiouridine synthesizing protein A
MGDVADDHSDTLDLKGLKCPLPAMLARRALLRAAPGTVIAVEADDPLAHIDIPHMCRAENIEVLSVQRADDTVTLVLRKPCLP